MIAGEEPELCVRLRAEGWKVWRLDAEMSLHDADIKRFSQWWKRSVRAGFAYAQGNFLHGGPPEYHKGKEVRSIIVWAAMIPLLILGLTLFVSKNSLVLLLLYPVQVFKVAKRKGALNTVSWQWAFFIMLGKFAEFQGVASFNFSQWLGKRKTIIEYK